MSTIEGMRARKLDTLRSLVRLPGMYATTGMGLEMSVQTLLADLAFIDDRDAELTALLESVMKRHGKLGVAGAFEAVFGDACDYIAEVGSVYAPIAARLGWLETARRLSAGAWTSLVDGIDDRHGTSDVRRSTVIERYGEPSLIVGKRVLCYASMDEPDQWVFFDHWEPSDQRYRVQGEVPERNDDQLLRDVRTPAPDFDRGLLCTKFGKTLRWGPGWWLDDPDHVSRSETPAGIHAQLRDIRDEDPSQSLGPRRPWSRRGTQ